MVTEPTGNGPKKNGTKWSTIGTAIAGGVLLALQGINLSEVSTGNEQGRQRAKALEGMEESLANQNKILENLEHSIQQNSSILENGAKLLDQDSRSLDNQQRILDLLEKNLETRKTQ